MAARPYIGSNDGVWRWYEEGLARNAGENDDAYAWRAATTPPAPMPEQVVRWVGGDWQPSPDFIASAVAFLTSRAPSVAALWAAYVPPAP